jgi:uncharacterized protein YkwD
VAAGPATAKPAASEDEPDLKQVKEKILAATNDFRKKEGQPGLKENGELSKAAQAFADFMAKNDKYGHTADGKEPWERCKAQGYEHCIVLENIAYEFDSEGFTTNRLAENFSKAWKDSPPHRKNLLDPDIFDLGLGVARSAASGKYYAVQDFGRPKSKEISFKITNRTADPVDYLLDDKTFTIKPKYTVTHDRCRPPELALAPADSKEGTTKKEKPFRPAAGDTYVIRANDVGQPVLEKERSPKR